MEENYLNKIFIKVLKKCQTLILFIVEKLQYYSALITFINNVFSIGNKKPRIFIVTFPKSGTTWMKMILYQLTTDGNMENISNLMDIIPFLEKENDTTNLEPAKIIKTHITHKWFWMFRKKGKFIYVMRDGLDVAVSYYHHCRNFEDYTGTFDEFYKSTILNLKAIDGHWFADNWFKHISDWLKEKDNPDVLFVRFEDMKKDLESVIREIIGFLKLDVKEEEMPRILERCSFKYMKDHEDKIDFAYLWNSRLEKMKKVPGKFLRKGKSGYRDNYKVSDLISYQKLFSKYLDGLGLDMYSKVDQISIGKNKEGRWEFFKKRKARLQG